MDIIKKYKVVILVVFPILILVLIRSFGTYHFQGDAKKWAEPSVAKSNIITPEQLPSLAGEKLIINLDKEEINSYGSKVTSLNISADSILIKSNIRAIQKHKGPVLLNSSDPALSARIWMVLSQMGESNIYILTRENDIELFKNKFRPDTLMRPEL